MFGVVQSYPWIEFYFPLVLNMVIYDNEFKTKENKFNPRITDQSTALQLERFVFRAISPLSLGFY